MLRAKAPRLDPAEKAYDAATIRTFFPMMRNARKGFLLAFCASAFFVATPLYATDIWLAGVDPYVREAMKKDDPSDYLNLFQPQAPWSKAAANTAVFKTSTQWILNGPDDALAQMFANLHERHIALAMEGLMIPRTGQCGAKTEGYSAPGTMALAAERIHKLGGELAYIAMDEPLWFGHHQNGPDACRSSLDDLASQVASNVQAVRAVFPKVEIGDIEVIGASAGADWIDEIMNWGLAFQKATGTPLAFFDADMTWNDESTALLPRLATELHARRIKLGVIYNGDPKDPTGIAWAQHAESHFDAVEAGQNLLPDHAVLQTWMLQPSRMLPEDTDGTMTHLILRYARTRSRLDGAVVKNHFIGHLTDAAGGPIANAAISILQREDALTGALSSHRLTGIVPAGATEALLALRINIECGGCNGDADVGLGPIHYEEQGGAAATRLFRLGSARASTRAVSQVAAVAGHPTRVEAPAFPVTPGQTFQLDVPMRASEDASHSGYLALIFLGGDKKEMRRDELPFEPGDKEVATATTDAQGKIDLDAGSVKGRVVYTGSDLFRSSEMALGK